MARSHVARQRQRRFRACAAAAIAGLSAALPLLSGRAEAQPSAQAPSEPLAINVTSVSPAYAQRGHTITITGQVRNQSSTAATGLSVQLLSSSTPLGSRSNLEHFARGGYQPGQTAVNVPAVHVARLGGGQRSRFAIQLPVSKLGLSCFGVYPLTVQVSDVLAVAQDPVPLPYWPPKATSCAGQRRPKPFPISWVWPLIDTPHQNACAGLTDNNLAARIAQNGRLNSLLAVGARYSSRAGLTWAIDPSLLQGVQAMTKPYRVGATARCRPGATQPADQNASRWLANVRKATAGQSVFLTPYADIDVAALTRNSDVSDLRLAFIAGQRAGHQILGRSSVPAPVPASPRQFSAIAWPPSGIASQVVLDTLAAKATINTVILAAPGASPVNYTPGAVSKKLTGIGDTFQILLADHAISALLNTKAATSASAGDIFSTGQLYLAETAMIASEAPSIVRPIMIAPPRRWDPPKQLASGLLADTVSAPWLKPSTVSQMVAQPSRRIYPKITQDASAAELPAKLLHDVSRLDHRIALLQSIRENPDPELSRAIYGIESSAWRGRATKHARLLFGRTSRYVRSQLHGVTIRGGGGRHNAYHVTFGGKTAPVNVVIRNDLRYTVRVSLRVDADHATVTGAPPSIQVPPLSYSAPVKLTVRVNGEHGKIRLSLTAPAGSRLAAHPLPTFPLVIVVHPTDFGTVALVICAAVLALFVIASAARAIRTGRPAPPDDANDFDGSTKPPTQDDDATAPFAYETDGPGPAAGDPLTPAPGGGSESPSDWIAPPEFRAAAGARAGYGSEGLQNLTSPPEYADSVGDGQEPRATEERR
ncbi:MAG TPA: hypothetical protein VFW16_13765 [Streptosporangiaceae bacterium]|nr:hypothetical protein [Streptosporangiaceae bacterium]